MPFINKPASSKDLRIFIMSSVSSSEGTSVVPKPYYLFGIAAFVFDAPAVTPNGNKTVLLNGVSTLKSTFVINGKQAGINGLRKLRNAPS